MLQGTLGGDGDLTNYLPPFTACISCIAGWLHELYDSSLCMTDFLGVFDHEHLTHGGVFTDSSLPPDSVHPPRSSTMFTEPSGVGYHPTDRHNVEQHQGMYMCECMCLCAGEQCVVVCVHVFVSSVSCVLCPPCSLISAVFNHTFIFMCGVVWITYFARGKRPTSAVPNDGRLIFWLP